MWQCVVFFHVGLLAEAREGLLAALATNPDDALTLSFLGQTMHYEGRHEEAERYRSRALAIDPMNIWANVFSPMGAMYLDQLDQAEQRIRVATQMFPHDPMTLSWQALLCAKRGENRKAEQAIVRALRTGKSLLHMHHCVHNAAAVYALTGKPAKAVPLLRKAAATGLPNYPVFRDDPHFRSLHRHPGFLRLMADLKREWESYKREFGRGTT